MYLSLYIYFQKHRPFPDLFYGLLHKAIFLYAMCLYTKIQQDIGGHLCIQELGTQAIQINSMPQKGSLAFYLWIQTGSSYPGTLHSPIHGEPRLKCAPDNDSKGVLPGFGIKGTVPEETHKGNFMIYWQKSVTFHSVDVKLIELIYYFP